MCFKTGKWNRNKLSINFIAFKNGIRVAGIFLA